MSTATRWWSKGALGANCTIVCGTRIGHHAFVGAGGVVTRDVRPFALMVGVPAKHIGWMSAYGERVDLPLEGTGSWTCPHTGITINFSITISSILPLDRCSSLI